jgi:hypothetical protein
MIKQDYEAAERQLGVVRRFRNPVVEAVGRLKDRGLLTLGGAEAGDGKRPGAVKGGGVKSDSNLKSATGARSSFEDSDAQGRLSADHSRSMTRGRSMRSADMSGGGGGKVQFRRQGSHDDIGLSRSQGSYDGADGDGVTGEKEGGESGVSPEEEMMRRMWESREVYDKGDEG